MIPSESCNEEKSAPTLTDNEAKLSNSSLITEPKPSRMKELDFDHFKYELKDNKLCVKESYPEMTREEEEVSIMESLRKYILEYMMKNFDLEEHFLPYENAPIKCNFLISKDYHTKEKLLLIMQNKSGSQMGIWSRSACLKLGLSDGTMIPLLEKATSEGYGIVIMNPNINSVVDPTTKETTLIPHSSSPTEHVFSVWNSFLASDKCNAKNIFILALGNAAILAKDITQKEIVTSRDLRENRITAIATVEASKIIEEDDSDDIRDFMSTRTINFEWTEDPLIKTGFTLTDDYRSNRFVLGISQCLAVQVLKISGVPPTTISNCIEEVFSYFDLASKSRAIDIGHLFAKSLAFKLGGPQPTPYSSDDNSSSKNTLLGKMTSLMGKSHKSDDNGSSKDTAVNKMRSLIGKFTYYPIVFPNFVKRKEEIEDISIDDAPLSIQAFKLIKVVGKGAYGKVMLVQKRGVKDKSGETALAMKIIKKSVIKGCNEVTHTQSERDILSTIQHPFIVKLQYAFQNYHHLYMVMDYYPGGNLFYHLKKQEYFSTALSRFYLSSVILALEYLHSYDIIFRDLKLENILMDKSGYIVLTDFGLAKRDVTTENPTRTFCGTPEYLAPELPLQLPYEKPIDWWTVGILLYEMLEGYTPFHNRDRSIMFRNIIFNEPSFFSGIDPHAKSLIQNLLRKDPVQRLGTGVAGSNYVKEHPFFAQMDWEALEKRQMKPPKKPTIRSNKDTRFISDSVKDMKVADSISVDEEDQSAPQIHLRGFTFKGKLTDDTAVEKNEKSGEGILP